MKNTRFLLSAAAAVTAAAILLSGCSTPEETMSESSQPQAPSYRYEHELNMVDDNYRNYYQVFVYSFCDSNGDGIGDLAGVTSRLDYIQDMGFNGIWLSPIMPSDSYHKYSVKDYYAIDEQYGTMQEAITRIETDRKLDGGLKYLEFARKVNQQQKVMSLWKK